MTPAKRELTPTERELIARWISAAEGVRATCQNLSAFDALIAAHHARLVATKGEKMPVTPQFILKGAWYALEQCGLLLRDANVLYRSGSYASTIALTAFAREELGRSSILLDLWRRASAGEAITTAQIKEDCDNHVTKQEAGMLSLTLRGDRDSGIGKILEAKRKNLPQSAEWAKAEAELNRIDETKKKRTPSDRHEKRMKALYVEPISDTEWNRPAATSALTAHDFLVDAINDYAGRCDRYFASDEILKQDDPELYDALKQWSGAPALQQPERPKYPGL